MMNCSSKQQRVSSENEGRDRLSELPDHILVHILSSLPIVDAVRTVLIRRFGDLWTLLPSLQFYDSELYRFEKFMRNVLIFHRKSSIDKFKLSFYNDCPFGNAPEIISWVRFAVDREVKELIVQLVNKFHLQATFDRDGSILPMRVFTSQFLFTLDLESCRIDELSRVQMPSLRKLSLTKVCVSNETLNKIISGSPALQELDVHDVFSVTELRFNNPNLKKLMLTSYYGLLQCPNLKILDIYFTCRDRMVEVDVSSIREVSIMFCYIVDVFYEYMKYFCDAEVFKYSDKEFLMSMFNQQDFPQTRWKRLHIESLLVGDQLLGICRVLRSSPHLEELVVYNDSQHVSDRKQPKHDTTALSPELPSCLMHQLKTITFHGYKIPYHSLLQLAEFLLKNSVLLEKMVILPGKNKSAASNEQKFVKQLLSFPRAASNARVIFGSDVVSPMVD